MNRPRQPARRGGFTLIEVLAASVAASILALSASTLLVLGWRHWSALQDGVAMQRDVTAALATLRGRLRGAAADEVSILDGQVRVRTGETEAAFYPWGTDLVYDPDLMVAGDEMDLVAGRLAAFVPTATNQSGRTLVTLTLRLTGDVGHDTTEFVSTVALRN